MKKPYHISFELNLALHSILGLVAAMQPLVLIPWTFGIILFYGLVFTIRNHNSKGNAHLAAGYLAGFEMMTRMSKVGFPHEMIKYLVIFLLFVGMITERRKVVLPLAILLFFLLLLPSIFVMDLSIDVEKWRQSISFNLAGPLCLTIASIYFYRRPIRSIELTKLFQVLLLPIASTVTYLFFKTPDFREITFSYGANFAASGYGPNQMSSLLGFGALIIIAGLFFKLPMARYKWVMVLFLALILFRGLLTFSRGGMLGPLIALTFGAGYYLYRSGFWRRANLSKLVSIAFIALLGYVVFSYVNAVSGNAISERYSGKINDKSINLEKYSSGRSKIFDIDWQIFLDHPFLGIGPGMGNDIRVDYGYSQRVAAHIEYSRLFAEHGILGFLAMFILIGLPLFYFIKLKNVEGRFLLVVFSLFCLSFMAHSATRIALPMFAYGLAFILYIPDKLSKKFPSNRKNYNSISSSTKYSTGYNLV